MISSITIGIATYVHRQHEIESTTKIGHAEIVSISNPSKQNKISITDSNSKDLQISINLDCNIDAVVRVKISPRYYDDFDRVVVLPNNIIYSTNSTQGNWIADSSNMCFYFNKSVKNISTLYFLDTFSLKSESIDDYLNCSVDFIVEVDILQTSAIDYDNHPWKSNAPEAWLEQVKSI